MCHSLLEGNRTEVVPKSHICLSFEASFGAGVWCLRLPSDFSHTSFKLSQGESGCRQGGRSGAKQLCVYGRQVHDRLRRDQRKGSLGLRYYAVASLWGREGAVTSLLRPLVTAHRGEGLEVSEAGFRDDRLWAPIFLPGLRWLLQLSQLSCWLLPTAFLGGSSRAYSPPPSFRAPSCGKGLASDLGTNPTSVLNCEVSARFFDPPGPPLPDLSVGKVSPCLTR